MRLIDADELLIAMDTWDKFGYDEQERLIPIGNDDERYVPYVHYADMVKAVNGMPTIDARADAIDEYMAKLIELDKEFPITEDEYGELRPMYLSEMCSLVAKQMKEQNNDNDRRRNG